MSLISAIFQEKCPQCRKGKLFTHPFYNIKKFSDTCEFCSRCNVKIEPEPGYFWGAMYVSYALMVGLSITLTVFIYAIVDDPSYGLLVGVITSASIIFVPIIYRLSRVIFIYLTAPYNKYRPEILNSKNHSSTEN